MKKRVFSLITFFSLSILSSCSSSAPFIGENGNWWINGVDTGYQAIGQNGNDGKDGKNGKDGNDGKDGTNGKDGNDGKDGTNGKTPYVGENGNWWIDGVDLGIYAGDNGTVTITFDTNGGFLKDGNEMVVRTGHFANLPIPVKEGKTFLGWYTGFNVNDHKFDSYVNLYDNLNLIAEWDSYDVTYLNAIGKTFSEVSVGAGEILSEINTHPEKDDDDISFNYEFSNWDFDFSKEVHSDLVIKPVFKKVYNESSELVNFGTFPQSVVVEEEIISKLNSYLVEEKITVNSGVVNIDVDTNNDGIEEKYSAFIPESNKVSNCGSLIKSGEISYFKHEPICWKKISSDGKTLKLCTNTLVFGATNDFYSYFSEEFKRNSSIMGNILFNDEYYNERYFPAYSSFYFRDFLNVYFYENFLTSDEKSHILTKHFDGADCIYSNKLIGKDIDVDDYFYLASSSDLSSCDKKKIFDTSDFIRASNAISIFSDGELYGRAERIIVRDSFFPSINSTGHRWLEYIYDEQRECYDFYSFSSFFNSGSPGLPIMVDINIL